MAQEPEVRFATKPNGLLEQYKTVRDSFSLNDGTHMKPKPQAGVPSVAEKPVLQVPNREISSEEVKAAVMKYAEAKQKDGSRQIATILKTAELSFSDNIMVLTLNNETQKEQFLAVKQHFMDEIRLDLQNGAFTLEVHLSQSNTQTKAYKPADIFKAMSEKNPALLELKKRFDLEIDY